MDNLQIFDIKLLKFNLENTLSDNTGENLIWNTVLLVLPDI